MLQGHFLNINAEDEPCLRPPWQVWPPELRVAVKERAALELAKRSLVVSWGAKHFRNAADMLSYFVPCLQGHTKILNHRDHTYTISYMHMYTYIQHHTATRNNSIHVRALHVPSCSFEVMGHKNRWHR